MEPDHLETPVIKLLHKGELGLKIHRRGTSHHTSFFSEMRKLDRHKAPCIQNQISLRKKSPSPH